MRKLYDNYDANSLHAEDVTSEENAEENDFIDALLNTGLMMHSMDFLASKGYFAKNLNDYRRVLKKIWFQPYSRSNHTTAKGSSGFEHIFLVEKKRGSHITGLHNWVFFATAEYHNKADYLGYVSKKELSNVSYLGMFIFLLVFLWMMHCFSFLPIESSSFEVLSVVHGEDQVVVYVYWNTAGIRNGSLHSVLLREAEQEL